ncbi:MAG: hypothetical protein SFZ02_18535 [bacterium]|nr:hypothetical protein [bacterium]
MMINEKNGTPIDRISDFVTMQWVDNKRIALFVVNSSNRHEVGAWADKVETIITSWRKDSPYAVLHDVTKAFLSPYAQKRALGLLHLLQENQVKGRYAVVVSNTIFGRAIARFVNFTLRPRGGQEFMGKTFTSQDVALAWLREQF